MLNDQRGRKAKTRKRANEHSACARQGSLDSHARRAARFSTPRSRSSPPSPLPLCRFRNFLFFKVCVCYALGPRRGEEPPWCQLPRRHCLRVRPRSYWPVSLERRTYTSFQVVREMQMQPSGPLFSREEKRNACTGAAGSGRRHSVMASS